MSYGRKRVEISLNSIAEFLQELDSFDVTESTSKKTKGVGRSKKIYDLPEVFWDNIRQEISDILISNYNSIKIINSPKYSRWKRRAKADGVSVQVTTDGGESPVLYVKGSLRTGFLRERIREVQVKNKRINVTKASTANIEYYVDISDLVKNYGRRFARKVSSETGKDLFVLTDQQMEEILQGVLEKIISNA